MPAEWIGCATGNFRGGRPSGYHPEAIVIHIAEGSLRSCDSWFNDPKAQVSAHYCVGRNGDLHQYVEETDTAFHAGIVVAPTWPLLKPRVNPNFYTIGIEHEGIASEIWPPAQLAASAALIAEIAGRWRIPIDYQHIVLHHEIRATKTCPGSKFDRNTFLPLIQPAPPPMPNIHPVSMTVHALANTNVRAGLPSTRAGIVRVLTAGSQFAAVGVTEGERFSGNDRWYRDAEDNFLWAGATDRPQL